MKKLSAVFRKFLLSYLIVLLIPNVAGYLSYRASIDVATASSIENKRLLLEQGKDLLEGRVIEVMNFTKQLAIDQDLAKLTAEKRKDGTYNVFGLWKMARDVAKFSRTNDYLQHFYIYFNNYDVVLAPNNVFFRPEHFYALEHYDGMAFEEWKDGFIGKTHENEILPVRPYIRDGKETKVLTFAQSLPLNSFGNPRATVVVTIEEDEVASLLQSISGTDGGWATIADGDGNKLMGYGEEPGLRRPDGPPDIPDGKPSETLAAGATGAATGGAPNDADRTEDGTLLISVRSETTGWEYTAGIPKQALMQQANMIKYVTWTLTTMALAVGLLIVLVLAYRNSAPIHRLLLSFRELGFGTAGEAKNEYDFLAGNISSLIANNRQLKEELSGQLPLLRDAFIRRLFVGEFSSIQEIEALAAQTNTLLRGGFGFAGLVRINGYGDIGNEEIMNELSMARLLVKQSLEEPEGDWLTTDWGSDAVAVLFLTVAEPDGKKRKDAEDRLTRLVRDSYGQYRLSVSVAMGASFAELRDIGRSFGEAAQALEYSAYKDGEGIVWYEDTRKETAMYYYPIDLEQRLIQTVRAGEREEGQRIMEQLFERNFEERELSLEMTVQFVAELKGTLLRLMEQKAFSELEEAEALRGRIQRIQPTDGAAAVRRETEAVVNGLCESVARRKSDQHRETVRAIVDYIAKEFANPDLTLYRIAEAMGRPEKFLSQLLKDHTGENLSEYVERTRMEEAARLLREKRMTIDEIAFSTGYNSSHSFRRAFKRVRGVSPSAYRHAEEL